MPPLRIYFADLAYQSVGLSSEFFPLNVGYIAAYCKKIHGEAVDIKLFKYLKDLDNALYDAPPDILALSNYPWCLDLGIEMSRTLSTVKPEALHVFGGPNFPHDKEDQIKFLSQYPEIDSYVYLEGEMGFSNLVSFVRETGDLKTARDGLKGKGVAGCLQLGHDGQILEAPPALRIAALDDYPSPYLTGILDPFFDGLLTPMLSTNRGCPFRCTFCADGAESANKVTKFSMERVQAELRYIAERVPNNVNSLLISDLNFGMFPRDKDVSSTIAELKDQYDYPHFIQTTTGKNAKTRVMSNLEILKGTLRLGLSVQSLNEEVLKNIKRDNIRTSDIIDLQPAIQKAELPSYTEVIIGLPGESRETHLETLGTLLELNMDTIVVYTCMLLHGSEMNTPAERKKWGMQTKFRLLPRDFGILRNGKIALEMEEVVVATNTLSFQDYLDLRTLALFVILINNNRGFRPLIRLLKSSKVKVLDFLLAMIENLKGADPKVTELVRDFEYDTEHELFVTEEEARKFYSDPETYKKLLEGDVGMNLIQHYTARTISSVVEDLCEYAFSQARTFLEKEKNWDDLESQCFEEIKEYCKGITHNLFGADRLERSPEFGFKWDVKSWSNNQNNLPLSEFAFENKTKIRFQLTDNQYKIVEDNLNRFGHTPHGRAKTLIRMSMDSLWRIPQVVNG